LRRELEVPVRHDELAVLVLQQAPRRVADLEVAVVLVEGQDDGVDVPVDLLVREFVGRRAEALPRLDDGHATTAHGVL